MSLHLHRRRHHRRLLALARLTLGLLLNEDVNGPQFLRLKRVDRRKRPNLPQSSITAYRHIPPPRPHRSEPRQHQSQSTPQYLVTPTPLPLSVPVSKPSPKRRPDRLFSSSSSSSSENDEDHDPSSSFLERKKQKGLGRAKWQELTRGSSADIHPITPPALLVTACSEPIIVSSLPILPNQPYHGNASPMNASNTSAKPKAKGKGKAKAVSEPVTVVGSPVDSSSSTVATSAAVSVVGSLSSGTLTLIALHDITETEGGLVAEGEAACITAGEATSATMRTSSSTSTSTSTSSSSSAGELEAESDAMLLLGSLSSTASAAATTVSSVSISSLKGIEIKIEARADVERHVEEGEGKWEEKIADAMDTSVFGSLLEVSPLVSLSPSSSMLSPSLSSSSVSTHSTSCSSSSSIPIIGTPLDISLSPLVEHIFALYAAECAEMEMLREEEDSAYRMSLEIAEEKERERERIREKRMKRQRSGLGVWGWLRPVSAPKVSFFLT